MVNKHSPDINTDKNTLNSDIGILISVLESGNSFELPATGYSMFPTLRAGDKVLVKPLGKGELPVPGSVVVCVGNGATAQRRNGTMDNILVLHRLVEIQDDGSSEIVFITRGDSMAGCDIPWRSKQVIGYAASYKRNNRQRSVKKRIPSEKRYKINRMRLWSWIRLRKINARVIKLSRNKIVIH
jgi:signal peptidase I